MDSERSGDSIPAVRRWPPAGPEMTSRQSEDCLPGPRGDLLGPGDGLPGPGSPEMASRRSGNGLLAVRRWPLGCLGIASLSPEMISLSLGMASLCPEMTSLGPGMASLSPEMTSEQSRNNIPAVRAPEMASRQWEIASLSPELTSLDQEMASLSPELTSLSPEKASRRSRSTDLHEPGDMT